MSVKLPKMKIVEMIRSDVSGKLFPSSECEIIVIKVVKGKDEDINSYSPFGVDKRPMERIAVVEKVEEEKPKPEVPGLDPASPEFTKRVHRAQSVIPPAFRDLFQKPPELM